MIIEAGTSSFREGITVPAVFLRLVQCFVCHPDKRRGIFGMGSVRDAAAYGEAGQAVFRIRQFAADLLDLGNNQALPFFFCVYHKHTELISSDSADIVIRPEMLFQHIHKTGEDAVSGRMAVGVVDLLELVDIKEQQVGGIQIKA